LYDLLVEGYPTPLTAAQIAELFHAGRLLRDDHCKEIGKTAWRTIDELFPLLKYASSAGLSVAKKANATTYPAATNGLEITRRTMLLGTLVALFVLWAFIVGPGYFSGGGTHQPAPIQISSTLPTHQIIQRAVPAIVSSSAYADEQMFRAARLRQEDQARQLEQTKQAEQRIIEERSRAQQERETQSRRSAEQEFTLPLGTYSRVSLGGASYRIAVHDDGPDEIRVIVDYRPVLRFQKHSGFDDRDVETLILSNGTAHLYYVNEISDHVGYCKLRLRDE
jgi:hypothetical protein